RRERVSHEHRHQSPADHHGPGGLRLAPLHCGMNVQHRKTWKNHLGNQAIQPLRLYAPESLDDVVGLVREAERSRCTVRAAGSGITFGPLPEQIRCLDLVAGGGAVYRIERGDGPTDPAAFAQRYPERRLVQDDDWFSATVVGMGCMGVIYAAMLAVEQKYWLKEVRVLRSWREVRADLRAGDVLRDNRHYEFLFNPYEVDGTHQCLVTTRIKTAEPVG